jgi:ribA/ribD-fused uncharacterized protein
MPDAITRFAGAWRFLSNFHPAVLEYDGFICPTAEHAFNMGKTQDIEQRMWVLQADTPGEAKRRGQRVTLRTSREDWDARLRFQVMAEVLRAKFTCRVERERALRSTGDMELVEGNTWHDLVWGRCICAQHRGAGANHLGRLLMELRAELRAPGGVVVEW